MLLLEKSLYMLISKVYFVRYLAVLNWAILRRRPKPFYNTMPNSLLIFILENIICPSR